MISRMKKILYFLFIRFSCGALAVGVNATASSGGRVAHFPRDGNESHFRQEGESCDPNDIAWFPVDDPHKFLYCDKKNRQLVLDACATVNNVVKIFDARFQRCTTPSSGKLRTPGIPRSSRFGDPCQFNTDCLTNMVCAKGVCTCVIGFIDSNRACVPTVAPGETGCSDDRECQAYWVTTKCVNGLCNCVVPDRLVPPAPPAGAGVYVANAVQTTEGPVCQLTRTAPAQVIANPGGGNGNFNPSFCPLPIPYNDAQSQNWGTGGPAAFFHTTPFGPLPPTALSCLGPATNCVLNPGPNQVSHADMAVCVLMATDTAAAIAPVYACCPNRAHTCMQPKPTEPAVGASVRYWFNQATGECEPFRWDGDAPWANNFDTPEHCKAYCGFICPHGFTLINNNGQPSEPCPGTACANTQSCQNVPAAGLQLCCPTPSYICGASNGRPLVAPNLPAPAGMQGNQPPNVANVPPTRTRWTFTNGACVVLLAYTGWGGHYNNFATQQECQAVCIPPKCDRGDSLKDANGADQPCGRGCPVGYECKSNACCPKKQFICVQPKRLGNCAQSTVRYWYNAATRDCEQFSYSGCNGNDNNFDAFQTCMSYCRDVKVEPQCPQGSPDKDSSGKFLTCSLIASSISCRPNYECFFDGTSYACCPQRAYTCGLNRQPGTPCSAPTTRWYFDTTSKTCQTFSYNGCDGNSNNFVKRQDCEQYCSSSACPYGGEPFKETSGQPRLCGPQTLCPSGYNCVTLGNGNAGSSSVNHCCMTRGYICQQTPSQGSSCGLQLQRYYYNSVNRQCATFTYLGCGGNENNFATLTECNNFCGSAACMPGEAAFMDPNSNVPLVCNPTQSNSCPDGYKCRADTMTNSNVCCGSNDMGLCPVGEKAFVDPLTNTAKECQPSFTSSTCPNDYFCRPNSAKNRYYCCRLPTQKFCPTGKAVYRTPDTNQPLICYQSPINQCPLDYSCQPMTAGQVQGFCCSLNALCPNNNEFFMDSTTREPRRCSLQPAGFNSCPSGYTCAIIPAANAAPGAYGFCCKVGATTTPSSVCSSGQPYLTSGVPQQCVPGQQTCPPNYACTLGIGGGVYYCCSTGTSDGCPQGTNAYLQQPTNNPLICNGPADMICPVGFSCQLSPNLGRYQCCTGNSAGGDGCPTGMVAYREPVTNAMRSCTLIGNQCPTPYGCLSTSSGQLQCCGVSGGCPSQMAAAINPSTGQPLLCTGGVGCPTGFQCLQSINGQQTCCGTGIPPPTTKRYRCPFTGQRAYVVPGTNQPQSCRVGTYTCPLGYVCLNGGDGYICCSDQKSLGSSLVSACPVGYSPYVDPISNQPRTCVGAVRCPAGYGCRYSATLRNYYCCFPENSAVNKAPGHIRRSVSNGGCPLDEAPFYPAGNSNPAECDDQWPCPPGYTCRVKSDGSTFICCRPLRNRRSKNRFEKYMFFTKMDEDFSAWLHQCWGSCGPANNCLSGYTCEKGQCCGASEVQKPEANPPKSQAKIQAPPQTPSRPPQTPPKLQASSAQPPQVQRRQTPPIAQGPSKPQSPNRVQATGSASSSYCPRGKAFLYFATRLPVACQLKVTRGHEVNKCPPGYRCTSPSKTGSDTNGNAMGICCTN